MKTNDELIAIWNELPAQEKMAMGDHYISHETDLRSWDKPFDELSPLKQKRVLQSVEDFSKVKFHGIIGSGIKTNTLEANQFKNGERVYSDNELFKTMKKDLKITNIDIAEIIGLTPDSVKNQTQKATFELNKEIRNNATRILLSAGVPVKNAIEMIKKSMPYLFVSKKQIVFVENSFNL